MIREEFSVVINRPIEEVFTFTTDFEKMTQWVGELRESKKTSEGPMGVGTTFRHVVGLWGRRLEVNHKVTEYEPNRKLRFGTASGPVPNEAEWIFESTTGGTKITVSIEAEPGGFFKIAVPLLRRMFRRQWETNLANLKDLLEAQA